MRKSQRRTYGGMRRTARPLLAALAVGVVVAPVAANAAPSDSVGASATFKAGPLSVTAPKTAVSFADVELDGRESYYLVGDIGDWRTNDARGQEAGWTVTVSATDPTAADDGEAATDAVMTMQVPTAEGKGSAPAVAPGDADGFVRLNVAGGTPVIQAAAGQGIGKWDMLQAGTEDLRLVMPFDTRAVRYDSTITFTVAPAL